MKVARIDLKALTRDRDQLFAEAVHSTATGESGGRTRVRARSLHSGAEARFEADAWQEVIEQAVRPRHAVTIYEIAHDILHIETPRIGSADQRRIASVLQCLGWVRRGQTGKGRIEWGLAA